MIIRAETPQDYAAIHDLQVRAFDNSFGVAALVALLRIRPVYDPDLALVAESDGRVVGHVMFDPIQVVLNGEIVRVVTLSPVGVHPDYQGQGVGSALIRAGHEIVRQKGYPFCLLLGHSDYYPRFGYITKAYGASTLTVDTQSLPHIELDARAPTLADDELEALSQLWYENESQVNLSIVPEEDASEWLSPNPMFSATVYRHEGAIVGYTRGNRTDVRLFLAKDDAMARAIAKHLAGDAATITLPLHPQSARVTAFDASPDLNPWEAAMIYPLQADSSVHDYLEAIKQSALVGRPIWSSVFDIA